MVGTCWDVTPRGRPSWTKGRSTRMAAAKAVAQRRGLLCAAGAVAAARDDPLPYCNQNGLLSN